MSMRFVSRPVGSTGMFCSLSWSGCGGILTGIGSSQSTSSTSHDKAGALHSLDFLIDCCIILADPCASWCSWVGSPSSISGLKSSASICITSPVFMCWVEWGSCCCISKILWCMLFTCEQSAAEYVCCKFNDVWKFLMFLRVASLRKLNSFSMLVLKSSM